MPIRHNYYQKGTNMGGLSVNARKRPQTFGQIVDLDCYSDPLKKVCKNIGLACGWLQSPTKIAEKAHRIWAHHTAVFHCNWLKLISLVQVSILLCLLSFCMRCCPTHFFGRCSSMGVTKGVHTGRIPHQESPVWPGNHGHPMVIIFRQLCINLMVQVC